MAMSQKYAEVVKRCHQLAMAHARVYGKDKAEQERLEPLLYAAQDERAALERAGHRIPTSAKTATKTPTPAAEKPVSLFGMPINSERSRPGIVAEMQAARVANQERERVERERRADERWSAAYGEAARTLGMVAR
jgi:hypothetical protein